MNKHNRYSIQESEFDLYYEGILDRLLARGKGVVNKLTGGPRDGGYNQGKATAFKDIFKKRIGKDIDKFLREITSLGVESIREFEQKYPEIANKIACMAAAIGHPTPLSTKCSSSQGGERGPVPPPIPPTTPQPPIPPTTPQPPPPRKKRWACRADGTCYSRPDGKYASKEECEAKCVKRTKRPTRKPQEKKQAEDKVVTQIINIIMQTGDNNVAQLVNNTGANAQIKAALKANGFKPTPEAVKQAATKAVKAAKQ